MKATWKHLADEYEKVPASMSFSEWCWAFDLQEALQVIEEEKQKKWKEFGME